VSLLPTLPIQPHVVELLPNPPTCSAPVPKAWMLLCVYGVYVGVCVCMREGVRERSVCVRERENDLVHVCGVSMSILQILLHVC